MIKQSEISNYVSECFKRFEVDFLSYFEIIAEEENVINYENQVHNKIIPLLSKYKPNTKYFLGKYENQYMDFAAKGAFVAMYSDYSIKCLKLVSNSLKFR